MAVEHHALGGKGDGLHARSADLVDRRRVSRLLAASGKGDLASGRLAGTGLDDLFESAREGEGRAANSATVCAIHHLLRATTYLAHVDLLDERSVDVGTLDGGLDSDGAELDGREGLERSAEGTDRGTGSSDDEDLLGGEGLGERNERTEREKEV